MTIRRGLLMGAAAQVDTGDPTPGTWSANVDASNYPNSVELDFIDNVGIETDPAYEFGRIVVNQSTFKFEIYRSQGRTWSTAEGNAIIAAEPEITFTNASGRSLDWFQNPVVDPSGFITVDSIFGDNTLIRNSLMGLNTGETTTGTYVPSGGVPPVTLSVSLLHNATATTGSTYTSVDLSTVTSQDKIYVLVQGETGGGDPNGPTTDVTVNGTSMTPEVVSTGQGAGNVSIYSMEGSVAGSNANSTVEVTFALNSARNSIQVIRLVNGTGATLISSDIIETTGQTSMSATVTYDEGILFASGYYSTGEGHTFTAGIETQYVGVQNGSGSGDGGVNTVPSGGNETVTYTRNGGTNTQGDALVVGVFNVAGGGGGGGGGSDVTPNAVNWNNINSSVPSQPQDTNTQQITGIDTTITLSVSFTQDEDQYAVGAYSGSTGGGSLYSGASALSPGSFTFDVTNNDYITFRVTLLDQQGRIRGDTVTVRNVSDGNNILDTFSIQIED